ncbi:MAG: MCE family protein [Acidobacteriaceae bacterium]|nr:MCE family protein [Acidobacteriaceae bacterium]MBV8571805.1 MCE family protein [Acidobacteriaceae bacterium]
MPSKEKVSLAQLRVGILGIVALACVALIIFLLTGNMTWFQKQIPLHVYTSDAAGLTEGAPVRINGIDAGKVDRVQLSGETIPQRVIKIDFDVNQPMLKEIPKDSLATIGSDNLLGSTKFLQITKGTSPEAIAPGATLKAQNTQQFDALVAQGFNVLDSAQDILQKLQGIVAQVEVGKGTIGKLLVDETLYNNLNNTVAQVQQLASTLNTRTGTIGKLINDDTLYREANDVINRINSLTQGLQQGQGTAGLLLKDPKMYNDLDASITQLNTVLTNLNQGKGTAGQLLKDDKIANQISSTLTRVNTTLDKVNSGQGTIGQLLVNPALYNELTGTTRELHDLLRDFRANPKKFLQIHLKIF